MKYIKTFENIEEDAPQVGDYVMTNCDSKSYWSNKIGQIVNIKEDYKIGWKSSLYSIKYTNVAEHILQLGQQFARTPANYKIEGDNITRDLLGRSIIRWSKDREDLELILNAGKYNL